MDNDFLFENVHFYFPNIATIAEDIKLVDTWMLWKRFHEEVYQIKKEMCTFIEEVEEGRKLLLQDITNLHGSEEMNSLTMGLICLKNQEIDRLTKALTDAVLYFEVNIDSELLEDDSAGSASEGAQQQAYGEEMDAETSRENDVLSAQDLLWSDEYLMPSAEDLLPYDEHQQSSDEDQSSGDDDETPGAGYTTRFDDEHDELGSDEDDDDYPYFLYTLADLSLRT